LSELFSYAPMRHEDLSVVLSIENISARQPWTRGLFLSEINNPRSVSLMAKSGDDTAGYILASHVLDEGNILNLSVHPGFRGKGIASELIRRVIGILGDKGCRSVYLEVRASNRAATGLYEKAGFRSIGTRKKYYVSPPEDAVIMAINIEE